MSEKMGLIGAIGAGAAPRLNRTEVAGLIISTINSWDMGYETAVIDANGAHPVERYDTEEEAEAGHAKWTAAAPTLTTVTKLGYGSLTDDETISIIPTSEETL